MAGLKLRIDRNRCIGSGRCVDLAPEVFTQDDDDGIVLLLQQTPPRELSEILNEAARQCPAMAIHVEDD